MKQSRITIFSICLLSAFLSAAAPLTPEQALRRVASDKPKSLKSKISTSLQPIAEIKLAKHPALYLFNSSDNGYLVVSADDETPALLGYSDSVAISSDRNQWPDGFCYWMDKLAEEIEWNRTHPSQTKAVPKSRPDREPIAPLCKTKWDQTKPYNDLCPKLTAADCPTGCAATAMAQIMKFHNWPEQGESEISYNWRNGHKTLSEDFSTVTFDWKNMLDQYISGRYSTIQAKAVAQLMKSAGYGLEMMYDAGASGAFGPNIPKALGSYFKYDKSSLQYLRRGYYPRSEWEELVYNSLKNDGPVSYNGQSNAGGHSFVCDGYSSDGYFHINWGWSGDSDGYFLLDALNPYTQGTGGSGDGSGFNFSQEIIIGIHPDRGGDSQWPVPRLYVYDPYNVTISGKTISFPSFTTGKTTDLVNYSCITLEAGEWTFAIRLTPMGTNEDPLYYLAGSMPRMAGFKGDQLGDKPMPSVTLSKLPENGSYRLMPCYRVGDGDWIEIPNFLSYPSDFILKIENGTVLISYEEAKLEITDLELSRMQLSTLFNIKSQITNLGEAPFYGNLVATLYSLSGKNLMFEGEQQVVEINPGETLSYDYVGNLRDIKAGAYLFILCQKLGDDMIPLTESREVMVYNYADLTANLTDISVPDDQPKESIHVEGTLNVEKGFYAGPLYFVIASYPEGEIAASFPTENLFIEKGQSEEFTMTCNFSEGDPSREYLYAFFDYNNNQLTEAKLLRLGGESGIILLPSDPSEPTVYYNLQGIRVTTPLPGQIYLRRRGSHIEKILY